MLDQKTTNRVYRGFAVFVIAGTAFTSVAQVPMAPPSAISSVFACRTVENEAARLECYDQAVGRLETAQKSGDIVAVSKADVEKIERESFGFNIPSLPKLGKLFGSAKNTVSGVTSVGKKAFRAKDVTGGQSNVVLEIARTKVFGYKKTRFYLKNGQVWEQLDGRPVRISKKNPGSAHIRKGALGSYLLRVNDGGAAISVKRVR